MTTAAKSSSEPCLICGQEGLDELEMRSHMLAVHEDGHITCPFCDFGGVTADEMSKHVNCAHLDEITPTKQPQSTSHHSDTAHNIDHSLVDALANGNRTALASHTGIDTDLCGARKEPSMDAVYTCPLCSEFVSDSPEVLTLHVNQYHFSGDDNTIFIPVDSIKSRPSPALNSVQDAETSSSEQCINRSGDQCATTSALVKANLKETTENKENVTPSEVRRETMSEDLLHCPVCDVTVSHGLTLEFHLKSSHPEFDSDLIDKEGLILLCPVCGETSSNSSSLQSHVNTHFSDDHTNADSQLAQELERRGKHASMFKQQQEISKVETKKAAVVWTNQSARGCGKRTNAQMSSNAALSRGQTSMLDFYAKHDNTDAPFTNNTGVDDGTTVSKGIIEKLQTFYRIPSKYITGSWMAYATDHYCGSHVDRGWGCGYRNFQMMLSCLVRDSMYKRVVFSGKTDIPSIPKIQKLIEEAWERGFDPQGREQLNGKLCNTRKWIGATEIFTVFASLKVQCQLVDFYRPTGPGGTHPCLFQWVRDYFQQPGFKPPVYLQHQGHSRSIVGVEENKDGTLKLVLFDPGTPRSQMQQFIRRDITPQLMRVIRRLPSGMKAKQYQILAVRGILSEKEQQEYKLLRSDRIP